MLLDALVNIQSMLVNVSQFSPDFSQVESVLSRSYKTETQECLTARKVSVGRERGVGSVVVESAFLEHPDSPIFTPEAPKFLF